MANDDEFLLNLTDVGPSGTGIGAAGARGRRSVPSGRVRDRRNPSSYGSRRRGKGEPSSQQGGGQGKGRGNIVVPVVRPSSARQSGDILACGNQLKGYVLEAAQTGEMVRRPNTAKPAEPAEVPESFGVANGNVQGAVCHTPTAPRQAKRRRLGPEAGPSVWVHGGLVGVAKPTDKQKPEVPPIANRYEDDDPEDDLVAAIAVSKRKDASLVDLEHAAAQTAGSLRQGGLFDADDDPDRRGGCVSFVDETRPIATANKSKRRKVGGDTGQPPPTQRRADYDQPKPGELVHIHVSERRQAISQDPLRSLPSGNAFEQLNLGAALANHLEAIGFSEPAPIQTAAIPKLMAGCDVIINAPTGSGKTLAYLAAIIADLSSQQPRLSRGEGTMALVLVPTRELALQVADLMSVLLRRFPYLVGGAIYGGENRAKEKARLRKGVTLVVATPGRLLDHLENTASFRTHGLRWLVLDEADRLLDLGFEQKIATIAGLLEKSRQSTGRVRQTVLLSATMHAKMQALTAVSLRNPVYVDCKQQAAGGGALPGAKGQTIASTVPEGLVQSHVEVPARLRLVGLLALLRSYCMRSHAAKIVVFMSSCDAVDFHHALLTKGLQQDPGTPILDCEVWKLHGSMTQEHRTDAFVKFSRCQRGTLLCTDVAARGLDFPAVTAIVQFDPPGDPSEYIHRIGRTARMGKAGEAVMLLLPSEQAYVARLQAAGCQVEVQDIMSLVACLPGEPAAAQKGLKSLDLRPSCVHLQRRLMAVVSEDAELQELAAQAFRSFVRAYAAYPAHVKDIFHVQKLHLGHVAHSFALRETPSLLGKGASGQVSNRASRLKWHSQQRVKRSHR